MPIAVMIQLAIQAASGAIDLLQKLGYLKPDEHEQVMHFLMNGQVPEDRK